MSEEDLTVEGNVPNSAHNLISAERIPVIIKKDAWKKSILFCQTDDAKLSFAGDSGAVGRFTCDRNNLQIDLKGRQYDGILVPGPTVLFLNLAPPVGLKIQHKEVARAEIVTNEFCHLSFSKDILGSMMGEYSGGLSRNAEYSDDESTVNTEVGEMGIDVKKKKAPVISNVTNRKRKVVSNKKSGNKKQRK